MATYRTIYIDRFENYIKQTYRNRCCIYSANGLLTLSIPVIKVNGNHTIIKDIEIAYSEPWQRMHWRAIESAYSNAPFFLYFRDELEPFYRRRTKFLLDLNHSMIELICKLTGIRTTIEISETYFEQSSSIMDFRNVFISAKKNEIPEKKYTQVFEGKHGFINNLSIIDLLFNEGKYAIDYLK